MPGRVPSFLLFAVWVGALMMPTNGQQEPSLKPEPVEKVNTKSDETDPYVTPDGYRLLYTSNANGNYELMYTVRPSLTKEWTEGKRLGDEPFNTKDADERCPVFTASKRLYFASNRITDEKLKDVKNFEIYERFGQLAPNPRLPINTKEDEMFPWVTADQREIYFSRKTKDGWRLFVAKGPAFGNIGAAELVAEIPPNFHHATLSPDARTMYLQGPVDKNRWGLFRTIRSARNAKWKEPTPLRALNHPGGKIGDVAPSLSPKGDVLFFASDRPGGQGGLDLYFIPTAKLSR